MSIHIVLFVCYSCYASGDTNPYVSGKGWRHHRFPPVLFLCTLPQEAIASIITAGSVNSLDKRVGFWQQTEASDHSGYNERMAPPWALSVWLPLPLLFFNRVISSGDPGHAPDLFSCAGSFGIHHVESRCCAISKFDQPDTGRRGSQVLLCLGRYSRRCCIEATERIRRYPL